MKEKKRKLNQTKKINRKKKSTFPKNQKPKTKKTTTTINPADDRIFIPSKFYFSDKQNITPRQQTQKIIPIIIKNKRKEKKQKGAKNLKLN